LPDSAAAHHTRFSIRSPLGPTTVPAHTCVNDVDCVGHGMWPPALPPCTVSAILGPHTHLPFGLPRYLPYVATPHLPPTACRECLPRYRHTCDSTVRFAVTLRTVGLDSFLVTTTAVYGPVRYTYTGLPTVLYLQDPAHHRYHFTYRRLRACHLVTCLPGATVLPLRVPHDCSATFSPFYLLGSTCRCLCVHHVPACPPATSSTSPRFLHHDTALPPPPAWVPGVGLGGFYHLPHVFFTTTVRHARLRTTRLRVWILDCIACRFTRLPARGYGFCHLPATAVTVWIPSPLFAHYLRYYVLHHAFTVTFLHLHPFSTAATACLGYHTVLPALHRRPRSPGSWFSRHLDSAYRSSGSRCTVTGSYSLRLPFSTTMVLFSTTVLGVCLPPHRHVPAFLPFTCRLPAGFTTMPPVPLPLRTVFSPPFLAARLPHYPAFIPLPATHVSPVCHACGTGCAAPVDFRSVLRSYRAVLHHCRVLSLVPAATWFCLPATSAVLPYISSATRLLHTAPALPPPACPRRRHHRTHAHLLCLPAFSATCHRLLPCLPAPCRMPRSCAYRRARLTSGSASPPPAAARILPALPHVPGLPTFSCLPLPRLPPGFTCRFSPLLAATCLVSLPACRLLPAMGWSCLPPAVCAPWFHLLFTSCLDYLCLRGIFLSTVYSLPHCVDIGHFIPPAWVGFTAHTCHACLFALPLPLRYTLTPFCLFCTGSRLQHPYLQFCITCSRCARSHIQVLRCHLPAVFHSWFRTLPLPAVLDSPPPIPFPHLHCHAYLWFYLHVLPHRCLPPAHLHLPLLGYCAITLLRITSPQFCYRGA